MTIEFACVCGQKLKAPDNQVGWLVRCPRCNAEVVVPRTERAASAAADRSQPSPPQGIPPRAPPSHVPVYPMLPPGAVYYGPMYPVPRTSGMAIASLVLGIVPVCCVTPILAIIFGHCAMSEIRQSGGMVGGRGMALAGLILGYIWTGLMILYFIFYFVFIAAVVSSGPPSGW